MKKTVFHFFKSLLTNEDPEDTDEKNETLKLYELIIDSFNHGKFSYFIIKYTILHNYLNNFRKKRKI